MCVNICTNAIQIEERQNKVIGIKAYSLIVHFLEISRNKSFVTKIDRLLTLLMRLLLFSLFFTCVQCSLREIDLQRFKLFFPYFYCRSTRVKVDKKANVL